MLDNQTDVASRRHRIKVEGAGAGYEVKVTATGTTQIVTGNPPRVVDVPDHVTAIAKKR